MSAIDFVEAVWGRRFEDAGCWPALGDHAGIARAWWQSTGLAAPVAEDVLAAAAGLRVVATDLPSKSPMLLLEDVALVSRSEELRALGLLGAVGLVVLKGHLGATPADVWLVVAELRQLAEDQKRKS